MKLPKLLALACLFLIAACGGEAEPAAPPGPPSLPVMNISELQAEVAPREGDEAILINFWATWCPPCVREMPELVTLHEELASEGVRVIAVSVDLAQPVRIKTAPGVRAFADERGFDLPMIAFDGNLRELQSGFGMGGSIPYTVVRNARGEDVATQNGMASLEQFRAMVEKARR